MAHRGRFGDPKSYLRLASGARCPTWRVCHPRLAALSAGNWHHRRRKLLLCLSLVSRLLYASVRTRKGFSMPADTTERPEWFGPSRYLDHFLFLHDLVNVLVERGEEGAREMFARTAPFHPEITIETHIRTAEAKCGLVSQRPAR